MKNTINIGIMNYKKFQKRLSEIDKGNYELCKDEPNIWFGSFDAFLKNFDQNYIEEIAAYMDDFEENDIKPEVLILNIKYYRE